MNPRQYLDKSHLGVCVKDGGRKVLFQNELCIAKCGNMQGRVCSGSCIEKYSETCASKGVAADGFLLFPKLALQDGIADAMMVRTGDEILTLLYPLEDKNSEKMEFYREKGLTKSELNIMSLLLSGLTNTEIAKKLFISKATLKTHINNVYKKIPMGMRPRS